MVHPFPLNQPFRTAIVYSAGLQHLQPLHYAGLEP